MRHSQMLIIQLSDIYVSLYCTKQQDHHTCCHMTLINGSVQRQPPSWWCHQLVAHPSETVRLPRQVHERGTVYRQLSAQPPHRLLPLKKNLNHFCLDCHSVCDNIYRSLTMFSALAAVCTVDCAIEIVLITLHYNKVTVLSMNKHFRPFTVYA